MPSYQRAADFVRIQTGENRIITSAALHIAGILAVWRSGTMFGATDFGFKDTDLIFSLIQISKIVPGAPLAEQTIEAETLFGCVTLINTFDSASFKDMIAGGGPTGLNKIERNGEIYNVVHFEWDYCKKAMQKLVAGAKLLIEELSKVHPVLEQEQCAKSNAAMA